MAIGAGQHGVCLLGQPGAGQGVLHRLRVAAIEDGRQGAEAQDLRRPAQVGLQHLADVHAAGHADGVEDDVHRCAVGQVGHILHRQDAGDDALVPVAAGHLVALRHLAPLGDANAHHLVDARGQLVLVLAGEDLHVDNLAPLAVRHAERGVLHLARLLAEDGPQQLLLGGELRLALGSDLPHQDVARLHLGADADDAFFVQIAQALLAHVGDVAGDLLRAQLGVASLQLVLLHVDGAELVLAGHFLGDYDGVLEVVALPAHEGAEQRLAQRQLAPVGGRAVCQGVAPAQPLPLANDGALTDAGALVGAHELGQLVGLLAPVVVAHPDLASGAA